MIAVLGTLTRLLNPQTKAFPPTQGLVEAEMLINALSDTLADVSLDAATNENRHKFISDCGEHDHREDRRALHL